MLKDLLEFLENKKILILGFGVEGKASYRFLREYFPKMKIYIADKREVDKENDKDLYVNSKIDFFSDLENDLVEIFTGINYLDEIILKDKRDKYDIVLKTPGLSLKGADIKDFENKIYTSIDLLLRFFNILTIGITGTKGKSTTSTIIYNMFKDLEKDVYLLGNIGIPVFDKIAELKEDSIVVLELSSHQLQFMKYTTKVAILINIYPEHLDHYNSYNEYIEAKYNIFRNEKNMKEIYPDFKQIQLYGQETDAMKDQNYPYNEEAICLDIEKLEYNDIFKKLNLKIKGRHNLQNALFALVLADILGLDINKSIISVENFKGLAHRLEYINTINNVDYYNDSIATIPEATISAINTLKETKTLIIGGLNRKLDYTILINFLNNIYDNKDYLLENIILLPYTGHVLDKDIREEYNKYKVKDVTEAAILAVEITKEGVCLLSPAAASYGFYKNFEERGNIFKDKINDLKQQKLSLM